MASAINCDLCEQEPAEMMQSNLTNGQTISVGAACMVTFFAGALAGMVGQLDDDGKRANELSLSMVTDAIDWLPASELPPQQPESPDIPPDRNSQERDLDEERANAALGREE